MLEICECYNVKINLIGDHSSSSLRVILPIGYSSRVLRGVSHFILPASPEYRQRVNFEFRNWVNVNYYNTQRDIFAFSWMDNKKNPQLQPLETVEANGLDRSCQASGDRKLLFASIKSANEISFFSWQIRTSKIPV